MKDIIKKQKYLVADWDGEDVRMCEGEEHRDAVVKELYENNPLASEGDIEILVVDRVLIPMVSHTVTYKEKPDPEKPIEDKPLFELDMIPAARDFHSDYGKYPDFPEGPKEDQEFDDWAADVVSYCKRNP